MALRYIERDNRKTSMDTPLISIGITYYKASETVEKAVLSAFAQTWDNTEIIIVDDCSDDGQQDMLDALQQKDPKIHVIHHAENKGVAAARNTIIHRAKGEFLAFFDDDDESLPERLEKQYQRIVNYEDEFSEGQPVICHTARLQKYPDGQERYEQTMGTNEKSTAPHGKSVALRTLTGKPETDIFGSTATCSQMARLSTYKGLNGFDENFRRSEDTDFNIRASMKGTHFPGISEALVIQTMTLASDKKLSDEKHYAIKLLEKHKDFIEQHDNYQFCHAWLTSKYDFLQKQNRHFLLNITALFFKHPVSTLKRFLWALPNIGFNLRFISFHHDKK